MVSVKLGMVEWIASFGLGAFAFQWISNDLNIWANSLGMAAEKRRLITVGHALQEIEEQLSSGILPPTEKWKSLEHLPAPWGRLTFQSLSELRASGGAILPTLRRLRGLAEEHQVSLMDAKAKSSQALSQALVCACLVPLFGFVLYTLLPGVSEHPYQWGIICGAAFFTASLGSAWLLQISSAARWGGLKVERRNWILASQCAGERFLSLVRSGTPADLAWTQSCELLMSEAPALAAFWGASVWTEVTTAGLNLERGAAVLVETGAALKKAVQLSLMEGRPCAERVESALHALRQELRSQVDRELSLLGTRALKPLFICVAPAVMGLLFCGMWITWTDVSAGIGF